MMKRYEISVLILSALMLILFSCKKEEKKADENTYRVPRVAFITSGATQAKGVLPAGVTIAHQYFNSAGALMMPVDRSILLDPKRLKQFDIILLSSSAGYHDADRVYSLTYMSDREVDNLSEFVKKGGYIISGDNVGRNTEEGEDRISMYQKLTPDNWSLSQCFGFSLSERNMKGFCIEAEKELSFERDTFTDNLWILVPDSMYSDSVRVLAYWLADSAKIPAITENTYGKGKAFLLASSYFLHPSNQGGFSDIDDIEKFYAYILDEYFQKFRHPVRISPWPEASPYAFSLTINADGDSIQFERIFKLVNSFKKKIKITAFVSGNTHPKNLEYMKENKAVLASTGYAQMNYRDKTYGQALQDILDNEIHHKQKFNGFRFPFTMTEAAALLALSEGNYLYESSLGLNPDYISGCVFPYKIPIVYKGFYRISDITEVSPLYHDDYFFFPELEEMKNISNTKLMKNTMLYKDYLLHILESSVKKYHGHFTWLGHPAYTGYNDTTVSVLETIIAKAIADSAWLTTPEEIAIYRDKLEKTEVIVTESKNEIRVKINCPSNMETEGFTIFLSNEPKKIKVSKGKYKLSKRGDAYYISFTAMKGQEIVIKYE